MLNFEKKTERFIEEHSLFTKGDYVVIGVSGGPDSLALAHFLHKRRDQYGIQIAIAHVNHMLRGEASKQDLEFVKEFCEKRAIVFKSASINISKLMEEDKTGLQETARKYRYEFFQAVLSELHAQKLAVAQHGDDQIETILMRLTRGASGLARAGIQPIRTISKNQEVIRPLLAVSKEEIEEYCQYYQLDPRRDASNEKRDYTRNRFRIDIIPFLKHENAHVLEHFRRFSEELTEDEQYLQTLAKSHFQELCQLNGDQEITFKISSLFKVPLPLQRRVIHLILNYLYQQKDADLTSNHVKLVQQLITSTNPSGKLDFPKGLNIIRSYDRCTFTFLEQESIAPYYYELLLGDRINLPNGHVVQLGKIQDSHLQSHNRIIVHPHEVELPIIVRTRRIGDRINVKGLKGTKKIKDIFIDQKVPQKDRSIWPIITDYRGELLWIPGLAKSCYDRIPNDSQDYYEIQYSNSGGIKANETRY